MNRNTIVETLKTDMVKYVHSGRSPYTSDISEVKRGLYSPESVVLKPFIGISIESDINYQEVAGNNIRKAVIYIYCYMDSNLDNYDKIHQMLDDVEYFLKYDYTYKDGTYMNNIGIVEGGLNVPCAFFDMYIDVIYQQDL